MPVPEDLKFEEALERLEKIVHELETGDLPLDAALRLFEEGVKLSSHCTRLLDQAEKFIEVVTEGSNGSVTLMELKPGSNLT